MWFWYKNQPYYADTDNQELKLVSTLNYALMVFILFRHSNSLLFCSIDRIFFHQKIKKMIMGHAIFQLYVHEKGSWHSLSFREHLKGLLFGVIFVHVTQFVIWRDSNVIKILEKTNACNQSIDLNEYRWIPHDSHYLLGSLRKF